MLFMLADNVRLLRLSNLLSNSRTSVEGLGPRAPLVRGGRGSLAATEAVYRPPLPRVRVSSEE